MKVVAMAGKSICVGASVRISVTTSTGDTTAIALKNGSKQSMQQPIERIASDPKFVELVTSACASVSSCLSTIGRNVACLNRLLVLVSISIGFVDVQPGFLQLFLTQT